MVSVCSCDNEDSCGHKITVYVKYSEQCSSDDTVPALVEGCVDSDQEGDTTDHVIHCDNDTITICDTRVRLRLCPPPDNKKRLRAGAGQFVPVKRKDLFKLLGLNDVSQVLDPSEEADAKKVALQNFLCSTNQQTDKVQSTGCLLIISHVAVAELISFAIFGVSHDINMQSP